MRMSVCCANAHSEHFLQCVPFSEEDFSDIRQYVAHPLIPMLVEEYDGAMLQRIAYVTRNYAT